MSKLIFGCGYLGERVARRWLDLQSTVHVVTRSSARASELQKAGFEAHVADVTQGKSLEDLPEVETIFYAVAPGRPARSTPQELFVGGLNNVLRRMRGKAQRIIFISTTGVYGGTQGAWVDETTKPDPQRPAAIAAREAETVLDERATVLRLAGLYGPGRIPDLELLRVGDPIPAPNEGWLNLIHVEDAAEIVVAAASRKPSDEDGPDLFCVSDGHPVQRGEYYREVALRIGAPEPRFSDPDPNSPVAARAAVNRRVSNRKLRESLPVEWKYPTYREGLKSILGQD